MATKTITFFGASGGVGLAALKHSLAAGHKCVALCRNPSTLTDALTPSERANSNLTINKGNAHDLAAVSASLTKSDGRLVDMVISTIGARFANFKLEDPEVCRKGMAVLLEALGNLRREDAAAAAADRPRIVVCSTTGISRFGRDIPLLMVPLYKVMLAVPHADKEIMEERLGHSGEEFTIVRCSLMMGGESTTPIRVGVEDPETGRESNAIGYTISREDAGRWFAENLIQTDGARYRNKIATITY